MRSWLRRGSRRQVLLRAGPWLLALALLVTVPPAVGRGSEEGPQRLDIDFQPHGYLRWDRGQQPVLLVRPRRGDGWITLAERYCGASSAASRLRRANPRMSNPLLDRDLRVPVETLRADLRLAAVRLLFPVDRRVALGWEHRVLDPFDEGGEESWEWLAELFTGRADTTILRRSNPEQAASGLDRGRPILVPEAQLLAVFREQPPVATPTPVARPTSIPTRAPTLPPAASGGLLEYGVDARGAYAVYRLRSGEALYSAVVVRFTGQLQAREVNATAIEIARRSGIEDVTSIPVGYSIKIPVELLLPKYLPAADPRRRAWEQERAELADFLEVVQATDLSGVHVIIDAGHGGADSGAVVGGLWEAAYAYDVACRIRANLEEHTRATVWFTRQDGGLGFEVPQRDRLPQSRNQFLLTRPRYRLEDSVLGVHLRWYLTNDIILERLGDKVPRSKTVFLSIHADSLHPSVRGAMVYVPSRYLRPSKYTVNRRDIRSFQEYKNHPTVRFGDQFKARVEASSRHLAENLVASLERNQIAVHPDEPVRGRVLRGRRSWVPAVLRYTAAQNAVLVECCNMANDDDRRLLANRRWREDFARGIVEGMAAAYNGS